MTTYNLTEQTGGVPGTGLVTNSPGVVDVINFPDERRPGVTIENSASSADTIGVIIGNFNGAPNISAVTPTNGAGSMQVAPGAVLSLPADNLLVPSTGTFVMKVTSTSGATYRVQSFF